MKQQGTIRRVAVSSAFAASALLLLISAASASAAGKWKIDSLSNPSVAPGASQQYLVEIRNVGNETLPKYPAGPDGKFGTPDDEAGDQDNCVPGAPAPSVAANCYRFSATFPAGITPQEITGRKSGGSVVSLPTGFEGNCVLGSSSVSCAIPADTTEQQIGVFNERQVVITAAVDPGTTGFRTASFEVTGAGAAAATALDSTLVTSAPAQFGIAEFDGQMEASEAGGAFTQAAGHPYALSTQLEFNSYDHPNPVRGMLWPVEPTKDVVADLPVGLLGNPRSVDSCTAIELANGSGTQEKPLCPPSSQVGTLNIHWNHSGNNNFALGPLPVFNMVPPAGSPARFGVQVYGTLAFFDAKLRSHSDYGVSVFARDISEGLAVQGTDLTFWGTPTDEAHRADRACPGELAPTFNGPTCPTGTTPKAFLRLPTTCTNPGEGLRWTATADSWWKQGALDPNGDPDLSDSRWKTATYVSHESPSYPDAPENRGATRGVENCPDVPVKGTLAASPTSINAGTSSGLGVHVEVPNPGLENPVGIASSDIKAVKVSLPQGMTINPSQAEGLGACAPAQYQSSRLEFHPDGLHGCPSDSKIGTVEVHTPLLEETIPGNVYIAQPYDNPFNSLLALYVVLEEPQRGVLIKLAGKVDTDPVTGQITASFDDLPQLPFSSFDFKFREGSRAPLVTPQACGTYETHAEFTGYSDPTHPISSNSSFQITRGIGGGPCPAGGLPPFKPGLIAGTRNNNAGSYSPFDLRLFRTDAEQEFTNFSIKLPPGITGKLAGIPFCSDPAIAAAKARTGAAEIASPSCPAASAVGRTLAGAGVGSVLTYAPGKIYLAGPYNGSPLSLVSVTAAKVGPFDLGTVVVRLALRINPETAEVFVDPTGSDPLPHIIQGITVHLRDIRAYVERPDFVLNPTSCDPTSTASTVLGSGLDFASSADDQPVTVSTRFQAASCASLGFKPKLAIKLKGGTRRSANPALRATLTMPKAGANISAAQVSLPHSEFLAQSHIKTICTRVQFKADQCPKGSIYGYAKAVTPLLDEPLAGPVYLRSSSHPLPDLIAALHSGKIDIDLAGRIDSTKGGGIRTSFESVPDAPVSKFTLSMFGGKKSLLENSTNLCRSTNRAIAKFDGQNGKARDFKPIVKPSGCKKAKKQQKKHKKG